MSHSVRVEIRGQHEKDQTEAAKLELQVLLRIHLAGPSSLIVTTMFVLVLGSIDSNISYIIPVSPTLLTRMSNLNTLTPRNVLSMFE